MKRQIRFTKMHGIGNDYVYLNGFEAPLPSDLEKLAIEMSDRHKGIGGDGIITMEPAEGDAHCRMRIFNADGSEAKMCGNGVRCVAKLFHDTVDPTVNPIRVDTLSGVKVITIGTDAEGRFTATVDMGASDFTPTTIPVDFDGEEMVEAEVAPGRRLTAVSMGNPHGVIFLPEDTDLAAFDVEGEGRPLEVHPMWPDRANIEFVKVVGPDELEMRVWERGSGETMACGTGACAVASAAWKTGRCRGPVTIHLRGGDLRIDRRPSDNHVMMTGPATTVFSGITSEE